MSAARKGVRVPLVLFSSEIERDAALDMKAARERPETLLFDPAVRESGIPRPDARMVGVCDVGPVQAALGAARTIRHLRPSRVVFLGTCGAYPDSGLEVGAIVAAGTMLLTGADVVDGRMRLPKLAGGRLRTNAALTETVVSSPGSPIPIVRVACTLGITEHDLSAIALSRIADVETMEVYGVAAAAKAERIPFAALLGVTNIVGEGGGVGWRENYRAVMRSLWQRVEGVL